jgi:anti-anti-sigma factor
VEVSVRESDGVTVVHAAGKVLGGSESDPLRAEFDRLLDRDVRRVLIDLEGVPWLNSAGLGVFLSAYSRLRERGATVRWCGVGPRVRGILRTTKLLTVLTVLDDARAGIRSFAADASEEAEAGKRPTPP